MLLTLSLIMWMVMAMQLITLMEEVVYFGIPAGVASSPDVYNRFFACYVNRSGKDERANVELDSCG